MLTKVRENWQTLVIGGAAVGSAAALLWYLLRDTSEEEDGLVTVPQQGLVYYKLTDAKAKLIGIRVEPDVLGERTGAQLYPKEAFAVSEIVNTNKCNADGKRQQYLKLADGRGWAFTLSGQDGRVLCEEVSKEEAMRPPTPIEKHVRAVYETIQTFQKQDPDFNRKVSEEFQQLSAGENPFTSFSNMQGMLEAAQAQLGLPLEGEGGTEEFKKACSDPEKLLQVLTSMKRS